MTTTDSQIVESLSDQLVSAWRSGQALDAAKVTKPTNASQAYQVQQRVAQQMDWPLDGAPRAWKVGAANTTALPNAAFLCTHGLHESPATANPGSLPFLGIEGEIAVRIATVEMNDDQPATVEIDACCVSIELVSSRFTHGTTLDPLLKLADQGLHHSLILGSWVSDWPTDWSTVSCELRIDNKPVAQATGAHPCGDPTFALPWLASHASEVGLPLRPGDIVTTGSWLGLVDLSAASVAQVQFDGIGSCRVERSTT